MYELLRFVGLFCLENEIVTLRFEFETLVLAVSAIPAVAANKCILNILDETKKCWRWHLLWKKTHTVEEAFVPNILKNDTCHGIEVNFLWFKITRLSTPSPICGAATYKQFNIALSFKNYFELAPLITDPPSTSSTILQKKNTIKNIQVTCNMWHMKHWWSSGP